MDFYNQMANPLQQWMRMQQGINAIHQLKTDAKDAMNKGDYRKALGLYSQTIGITNVFPTPHEEVANLYCNRSLAFYNLELYPDSLSDAAQSISIIPNFVQGYYRQGMALKCLNMPVEAAGCFINAINSCRPEEQNHYQITCYRELILLLCDIEDISDLESPVPKTYAMKKEILQQLVSKRSWKAVSYVLLGAITGADSALAGTFSDFDCSFTSIFELLQETSDEQKRKWACKLAVKLFSNGASFAEFEKNINGNVIHFGIELALKLGDVDFLKYLLSASKNKDSVDENGDTGLHVIVKKQEVRKSTLGETIVGLLVNHGCRVDIKDSSGNKPIDYTSETEQVYSLLQSKKTMDVGIFGKIDSLREEGKKSLNENKLETALGIYNEVIKLCLGKPELTKEAAKFYTNRANVFSKLQQNEAALKDAEDAIKIDPSWRKAYWRKGKELCFLQRYDEAFDFFIQMISSIKNNDCDENEHKDLIDFVVETAITFPRITENKFQKYKHMFTIPTSLWSQVLVRLSKNAEWAAIRYLILGLTTDIPPHRALIAAAEATDV